MKKSILIAILFTNILITKQVMASSVIGATEPTQWLNNGELALIFGEDGITALQQTLSTGKQVFADPIAAGLIAVAQKQATDSVIAWANGGFSGTPLIVQNPGNFIKNAGLTSVVSTLSKIPTESVLGDSIFTTIINNNKDISIATKLKELSKSPTASVLQKTVCDDPDTLMKIAIQKAKEEGGGVDQINDSAEQYNNDLYEAICEGDPDTDPAVAKKLDKIAASNPSLGGWDLWLTSTTDTPQQRIAKAAEETSKLVQAERDLANKELMGMSAVSQKECVKEINFEGLKICEEDAVLNPGKAVQDAISKAALAPIDRITGLSGADGLTGILTGFITSALTKGLNTAFTSTRTTSSNTSVINTSKAPVIKDLENNPEAKASISGPMIKQLNASLTDYNSLDTLDSQFLADMNSYEQKVQGGKSCYDSLVSEFPSSTSNLNITSAYAIFNDRQNRITAFKTTINNEKAKIAQGIDLANETRTKLAAVKSTQEVGDLYAEYSTKVEQGGFPGIREASARRSEYQRAKSEAERDNDLKSAIDNCNTIRQQEIQKRNNGGNGYNG